MSTEGHRMRWERVEPVKPCTSPDGHDSIDVVTMRSHIPERVLCPRCGEPWQVVVLPEDEL